MISTFPLFHFVLWLLISCNNVDNETIIVSTTVLLKEYFLPFTSKDCHSEIAAIHAFLSIINHFLKSDNNDDDDDDDNNDSDDDRLD